MIWLAVIAVAVALLALVGWASRGRGASDEERSSSWTHRGGDGGGGLGL